MKSESLVSKLFKNCFIASLIKVITLQSVIASEMRMWFTDFNHIAQVSAVYTLVVLLIQEILI